MKKFLSCILILSMLLSMTTVAFAAKYNDTNGHWGEEEIDFWSNYGIVEGDGVNFFPDNDMTRGEAAAVFVRLLKLTEKGDVSKFVDLKDNFFADYMAICYKAGIIKGTSENTMSPDDTLTREEMIVMFGRAIGVESADTCNVEFDDMDEISSWAKGIVYAMVNKGYIKGTSDITLEPTISIDRASVMALLYQTIEAYVVKSGDVEVEGTGIIIVLAEDVNIVTKATNIFFMEVNGVTGTTVNASDLGAGGAGGSGGGSGGGSSSGSGSTGSSTTGKSTTGNSTTGKSTTGSSTTGKSTTGSSTTGTSTTGTSTTGNTTTGATETQD